MNLNFGRNRNKFNNLSFFGREAKSLNFRRIFNFPAKMHVQIFEQSNVIWCTRFARIFHKRIWSISPPLLPPPCYGMFRKQKFNNETGESEFDGNEDRRWFDNNGGWNIAEQSIKIKLLRHLHSLNVKLGH